MVAFNDDFSAGSLGPGWSFVDPLGDCSLDLSDNDHCVIQVAAGAAHDLFDSDKDAPRIIQSVGDTDFTIEVWFDSVPDGGTNFQGGGLYVGTGTAGTWIRAGVYGGSNPTKVFACTTSSGSSTPQVNTNVTLSTGYGVRVARTGDDWEVFTSDDGSMWTSRATFSFAIAVTDVGVYGLNAGSNPSYAATADYFTNSEAGGTIALAATPSAELTTGLAADRLVGLAASPAAELTVTADLVRLIALAGAPTAELTAGIDATAVVLLAAAASAELTATADAVRSIRLSAAAAAELTAAAAAVRLIGLAATVTAELTAGLSALIDGQADALLIRSSTGPAAELRSSSSSVELRSSTEVMP